MKTKLFLLSLAGMALLFVTSCKDGPIQSLLFPVTIVNNTTDHLYIYEQEDGSDFFRITDVEPGQSVKEKGFTVDTDYNLQARLEDGTVVESLNIYQEEDDEVTWIINP